MRVIYRPAQTADLQSVSDVYWQALTDVYRRHGFEDKKPFYSVNPFYAYVLRTEPHGFFVAEDGGNVAGAAISWMRGSFWFLSHLFVSPEYHGRGIGKTLLGRALESSTRAGAGIRSVITMAFNPTSLALYMKNGMYPLQDIYLMQIKARKAPIKIGPQPAPQPEGLTLSGRQMEDLKNIDTSVLGMDRELHHRYFLEDGHACGWLIHYRQKPAAYAYQWPDGRIGPVAALHDSPYRDILKAVIRPAMKEGAHISLMVPGTNRIAMEVALSLGFTIRMPYLLLSSQPFGSWDRYLFQSPGMM